MSSLLCTDWQKGSQGFWRVAAVAPCRCRDSALGRGLTCPRPAPELQTQPRKHHRPHSQSQPQNYTSRRTRPPLWRQHTSDDKDKDGAGDAGDADGGGRNGSSSTASRVRTGRQPPTVAVGQGGGGVSFGVDGNDWYDDDGDVGDDTDDTYVREDGDGEKDGDGDGGGGADGPLGPTLAEELRELERLYGSADRTRSSHRSRQNWLDRRAAEREAVYGARHRDADVRLLALRRYLAAAGKLRRRGRFAPNDAMPRPSTWHKLPPGTQRQILDERAQELLKEVGLSLAAGRRLYVAAPGLLCDISYGVASRLRALASRLGCSVEGAAAAIAARPLLGELRLDLLEATAAELSVWLGGGLPLGLVLQRLAEEPSLAAQGSLALISRCEALCASLGLSRPAALQYMVRQPRLMALDPRVIPARVAAARRLVQLAAGRAAAAPGGSPAAASTAAAAPPPPPPPASLLLCSGSQLAEGLTLLQRLLALPPPATAAVLTAQPALALQPPAALSAAADFLCANLSAPPPPPPRSPRRLPPAPAFPAAAATAAAAVTLSSTPAAGQTWLQPSSDWRVPTSPPEDEPYTQRGQRQRPPGASQQRPAPPPAPQTEQSQPLPQQRPRARPHLHPHQPLPPPHVQRLVQRCPDVLLLEPRRAAEALDVLECLLAEAAAGAGAQREGVMAAAMVVRAPQLLLCKLVPPAGCCAAVASGLTRSRRATTLALVKAVCKAQRKRHVDAASLALESPNWPRPLIPLPCEYGTGAVAPAAGIAAAPSVLDVGEDGGDGGGALRRTSADGESALRAAAAAAGVEPIPIHLDLREAELLQILAPDLLASELGAEDGRGAPSRDANLAKGAVSIGVSGPSAVAVRAWLWCEVLAAEPRLLLLPSAQLAATVELLSVWLAVPAAALSQCLFPYGMTAREGTSSGRGSAAAESAEAAAAAAAGGGLPLRRQQLPGLRRHHAALLVTRPDMLQRAGYRLWAWLGGAAVAAAADVAAVLRALPGLLYDHTALRICALVLHELLGKQVAAAATPPEAGQEAGLPAWVGIRPPADVDSGGSMSWGWAPGAVAVSPASAGEAVPAMPAAAAALLLRFPAEVLSEGVLQLLGTAAPGDPLVSAAAAAAAAEAGPGARFASERSGVGPAEASAGVRSDDGGASAAVGVAAKAGDGSGRTRLDRATALLGQLLGVGRPAAAALVLATRGSAAGLVEDLPPSAMGDIGRAMSAIRRGDTWRRELRRYLYGSTSYGTDGRGSEAGGESIDAVAGSARELLGVLAEWRRAARLEALEAAGVQDAVSFATVLQLPEDEWRDLATTLQL